MCHHIQLIFVCVFLVEMEFHNFDQADLQLLTSGDLPAWAPKVLGLQAEPLCPANYFFLVRILLCCLGWSAWHDHANQALTSAF